MKYNQIMKYGQIRKNHNLAAERWQQELWDKLLTQLVNLKAKDEAKVILSGLMSDDEKMMMLRRLAAITLIRSGESYRAIGRSLWMSPQTVSTIKKNMLGAAGRYKSYKHFYGGSIKYSSGDLRIIKSFWDKLADDINFDIKDFLQHPFYRPSGLGIMNAWDVRAYRDKVLKKKR